MRVIFQNITEDDGFQLIQPFNWEWKIGPKFLLDFTILTPQLWGTWGSKALIKGGIYRLCPSSGQATAEWFWCPTSISGHVTH